MMSLDLAQPFALAPRTTTRHDQEDFTLYPESLNQGVFGTGPLDMSIPLDSFVFPASSASLPLDQSPSFAGPTNYMYSNRLSPGVLEDGDLKAPPSNVSSASVPSASSSAVGSPRSHHGHLGAIPDWTRQGLGLTPSIVPSNDFYNMSGTEYTSFAGHGVEDFAFDFANTKPPGFVDPSLIHPDINRPMPMPAYDGTSFHYTTSNNYAPSPSASSSPQPFARNGSRSPYMHDGYQQQHKHHQQSQAHQSQQPFSPFQQPMDGRRPSVQSFPSTFSEGNTYSGDEAKEKQRCPHPDCGKTFKDLKAHMLTHQTERPEKCPIQTCDYHVKGFARKYDKNRHTLTHYKGTMVCGFCPGSGSAAEKSFNRADVFKRHLTAVHGVEQTPPNSRKKATSGVGSGGQQTLAGYAPDATGKCSTCSQTFSNAQDFYEHLDDCVLRIVQQEDPSEAVNARLLAEVENDKEVVQTLQRNSLPTQTQQANSGENDDEDDDMDEEDDDGEGSQDKADSPSKKKSGGNGTAKSRGLTHSRGGVPLRVKGKGRKNKHKKPQSWGINGGYVTMKKRVMCAFDGPRRLAKDDMMLSTEHEVRVKLSDGKSYTTDLDILTMKRAEGFHSATEEEKGLWISDDPTEAEYRRMQEFNDTMAQQRHPEMLMSQTAQVQDFQDVMDCNEFVA